MLCFVLGSAGWLLNKYLCIYWMKEEWTAHNLQELLLSDVWMPTDRGERER